MRETGDYRLLRSRQELSITIFDLGGLKTILLQIDYVPCSVATSNGDIQTSALYHELFMRRIGF